MSGLKFLITILFIFFVFRSVMKKVVGAVNPEGSGSGFKGKLGEIIDQVKDEIEKARLEMERETASEYEDPRDGFETDGEEGEQVSYSEEIIEEVSVSATHDRWNEVDEHASFWDSEPEERGRVVAGPPPEASVCKRKEKGKTSKRGRLREAVIWKEILDRPVGLR